MSGLKGLWASLDAKRSPDLFNGNNALLLMTDQHPITPPPELQEQWKQEWLSVRPSLTSFHEWMLAKSAEWGADQELEACREWLTTKRWIPAGVSSDLRAARRPEPPSLKEQALAVVENSEICDDLSIEHAAILRRALESLSD